MTYQNNMNIAIIGGGIGGIYCAYKLHQIFPNYKCTIYSPDLGGRVRTDYSLDGFPIEKGAGRFASTHNNLLNLIDELGLSDSISEIKGDIKYVFNKSSFRNISEERYNKVLNKLLGNNGEFKKTLDEYAKEVLEPKEYEFIRKAFPYDSEFRIMNSIDALNTLKEDHNPNLKYFVLNIGLSKIIDRMFKLSNAKWVKTRIKSIKQLKYKNDSKDSKNKYMILGSETKDYKADIAIFNLPPTEINKINGLLPKDSILRKATSAGRLIRWYAKYDVSDPDTKKWLNSIGRTITDNEIRYIIPISPKDGLIMISYTDGKDADLVHNIKENERYNWLSKQIEKTFGLKPPSDPLELIVADWKNGAHYWNPDFDSATAISACINPNPTKLGNTFIVNSGFSKKQAWMEGSLEMAQFVMDKIINNEKLINNLIGGKLLRLNQMENIKINKLQIENSNGQKELACSPIAEDDRIGEFTCMNEDLLKKIAVAYNESPMGSKHQIDLKKTGKTLWKNVQEKIKQYGCNYEHCWDSVKELNPKIQKEVSKRLRPLANEELKSSSSAWLSTLDIDKVMQQYEEKYDNFSYFGAVPNDFESKIQFGGMSQCISEAICNIDLNKLYKKGKRILGFVFNLDASHQPGSHWMSMIVNMKQHGIYFFDSYGVAPTKEILDLMKRLRIQGNKCLMEKIIPFKSNDHKMVIQRVNNEWMDVNKGDITNPYIEKGDFIVNDKYILGMVLDNKDKHLKVSFETGKDIDSANEFDALGFKLFQNKRQFQFEDGQCGIYSIYFIVEMLEGKSFQEIQQSNKITDDYMIELRRKYFRI